MSINKLFWSIASVFLAASAHADLVGFGIIAGASQHPDGQHETVQILASFSDANDKLIGVDGNPLRFITDGGDLYNQAVWTDSPFNDFPSVGVLGGEAYDSYVTIGVTTFPSNTVFTDDFLGDWEGNPPPIQVIKGKNFCGEGGWFFNGDPPTVDNFPDMQSGNQTFDVIIAQFTVDNNVKFLLQGNIIWQQPDSDKNISTPFNTQFILGHFLLCPWDLDGSDNVSTADLLLLFAAWGPNSFTCGPPDFNNDGFVNTSDLLELLANWGPCDKPD